MRGAGKSAMGKKRHSLKTWIAMGVEVIVFLGLAVWISKAYLATLLATTPTVKNLELAAKLDPGDATYQTRLGEIYLYSLEHSNLNLSLSHLKRATELNPRNPVTWLDLASALDSQGNTAQAEACLRRADFLAPTSPDYQWAIGNSFLLHGNVGEAFKHFKMVLAGTTQYNGILFRTAWKASGDPQKILQQLIPNNVNTEFDYLDYLVGTNRYPEAHDVWKRIATSTKTFAPKKAALYIDKLIQARHPGQAYQVWSDLQRKGIINANYVESKRNLLVNGDFEEPLLNIGFDWRVYPIDRVSAGLDETTFHSPAHSFLIEFSGKDNVNYRNFFQYVRVTPGHSYRLHAYMKAQGITTDSGPRLEVRDAYNPGLLEKFTDGLHGTTTGWNSVTLNFTAGPRTKLVIVGIARLPSQKFDNMIAGKVWVDDLSLVAVPNA